MWDHEIEAWMRETFAPFVLDVRELMWCEREARGCGRALGARNTNEGGR
jgi:hypothetical protein